MKLPILDEVLTALSPRLYLVAAGGCARDLWHGNAPKDYDLFVIQGCAEAEDAENLAERAKAAILERLPLAEYVRTYYTYREHTGLVAYVIKFKYKGIDFDLLEYMEAQGTPEQQVSNFDSTLSMAWLQRGDPEVEADDEFHVITHARFNAAVSGQEPVRHLPTIECDVNKRLRYLQAKYPQYTYEFLPEVGTCIPE